MNYWKFFALATALCVVCLILSIGCESFGLSEFTAGTIYGSTFIMGSLWLFVLLQEKDAPAKENTVEEEDENSFTNGLQ